MLHIRLLAVFLSIILTLWKWKVIRNVKFGFLPSQVALRLRYKDQLVNAAWEKYSLFIVTVNARHVSTVLGGGDSV